jgi:hypothetical protein
MGILEKKPVGDDPDSDAPVGKFPESGRRIPYGRHIPEEVPLGDRETMEPIIAPMLGDTPFLQAVTHLRGQGFHRPVEPFPGYDPDGAVKIPHNAIQIHPQDESALVHIAALTR